MREPKQMIVNRKEDIFDFVEGNLVKVAIGEDIK